MADHDPRREQSRARAKAWAAELDTARRRAGLVLPGEVAAFARRLRQLAREWALAEVAPGRMFPWLAVAFGVGIALYFTADREPAWWATLGLAAVAVSVAILARHRAAGFTVALAF